MPNQDAQCEKKPQSATKRFLKIFLQVAVMIAMFAALLWYVGIAALYEALLTIKVEYLALAFLMYFGINVIFTFRLQRVLAKEKVKTSFGKTLLAQYAGMLTSDVTPGRSGYILTPVYLSDQKVPASKGLSAILGIQTIEFLVKVVGGVGALIYLLNFAPTTTWNDTFTLIAVLGIALMLTGAIVMALFTWSKRAISIFDRIAKIRFLKRFTGGLICKLEEYKESSHSTRSAIPEITILTLGCWILKGFEWWFLGLALGLNITWVVYFLIHPLVTALAFVPITPAGAGVQEFGIVGIFALLGVAAGPAGVFALLARGILILEDLIGLPQIIKTTSIIFSRKPQEKTLPPTTPSP